MFLIEQKYEASTPVDSLIPHPENPREGNVGLIAQSIGAVGFYGAIIVQASTRFILAGKHRYLAALEDGSETVPVIFVNCDDDTARRIMLVDNRASDEATYNDPALMELLRTVFRETGSLEGTGYDGDDLDNLIADAKRAESDPIRIDAMSGNERENQPARKSDSGAPRQTSEISAGPIPKIPRICPNCGCSVD